MTEREHIAQTCRGEGAILDGNASPGQNWRQTAMSFVAPDAPVRIEISPRSVGQCEVGAVGLHRRKRTD